jgi:hypothetical protein
LEKEKRKKKRKKEKKKKRKKEKKREGKRRKEKKRKKRKKRKEREEENYLLSISSGMYPPSYVIYMYIHCYPLFDSSSFPFLSFPSFLP